MPEFRLPDLGEGVTEGEVVEWRVSEGGPVSRDQILLVVGTDKATVEIPSPFEGTVDAILAAAGARVEVGQVLIRVRTSAEEEAPRTIAQVTPSPAAELSAPRPKQSSVTATRAAALPAVRRAAAAFGLNLEEIAGSGPGGRVGLADLAPKGRRVALRGARRVMAQRMADAHRHVPQVTVVLECDMGALEATVARLTSEGSQRVSILGLVTLATVDGLRAEPVFNAALDEERLEVAYSDAIHIGIAVQTNDGLKVATVRDCHQLSSSNLQMELDRLVVAARSGALSPAELTGATFTISSGGRLGGLMATPLVNWPNLATLGIHQIEDRPVVRHGEIVVGRCANLSLSFDHRVIDGMTAAGFLYALRDRLVEPDRLIS
ncbi:MAG: dihydrolipoamide acetyltransferase family protein [Candidatus Dormibacteria bacterium]